MFVTKENLILASGSPRRQDYLNELGIVHKVQVADIDETPHPKENPIEYVSRMAFQKAEVIMGQNPEHWVIAADTIVVLDQKILGKPTNAGDAVGILMLLSGREHEVITAFSLGLKKRKALHEQFVVTKVRFSQFSEKMALAYVETGEPLDKAGAYGIQGKGALLVRSIKGSFSNVVGLPLSELTEAMRHLQIIDIA